MEDIFWMVYVKGSGMPTFKHATLASAKAEAERLVRKAGARAYILEPVACCYLRQPQPLPLPVVWEELIRVGVPVAEPPTRTA